MVSLPRKAIWLGYWALCLVLTHLPPPERPAPPYFNDKLMHFAGFLCLGLLSLWQMFPRTRRIAARAAVMWFVVLVSYAAFDELTQPWFRRDCEFSDWLADAAGAALGIGAALVYYRAPAGKVLMGGLLAVAWLAGSACNDTAIKAQKRRDPVRVVLVGESKDDLTWAVLQATGIQFSSKNQMVQVDVVAPPSESPAGQQKLLREQLSGRPQALCICPIDPAAVRTLVDELSQSGVPVVTVGRDIPNSRRAVYCGPSDFEIGAAAARACSLLAPPRSRTAMLLHAGVDDPLYGGRYAGFKQAVGTTGPMELLREVDCRGDIYQSVQLVRAEARRFPRVGCWVFLEDWPLQALPREDRILPVGSTLILCNGEPRHFDRIRSGQISALIAYDFRQTVEDALSAAVRLGEDKNRGFGSTSTTKAEIITARQLPEYEARWRAWASGPTGTATGSPGG